MGKAAIYFYNASDADKQTLFRRVIPSDTQFEQQQQRWNDLADFLVEDLRAKSGYPIRTWLQGSYKFGTQIRPVHMTEEFDIDLGIYYCWNDDRESGAFTPRELKQLVQDSLGRFRAKNADAVEVVEPAKPRCCRIRFKDSFHIDIPSYHLNEALDHRSLATQVNTWEDSDPKAMYVWFKNEFKDDQRVRVRRCVRYLKAWAALKFKDINTRPSSLLLTVLACQAAKLVIRELPTEDDDALAMVLKTLSSNLGKESNVSNPVDKSENLANRLSEQGWRAFVEKISRFAETAASAVGDLDALTACSRWALEFEHLFPLPEAREVETLTKSLPAVRTLPDVRVNAISKDNPNLRFTGVNEIGPIPKNCNITFEITNTFSMPPGTDFYWTVRNEGDEAEDTNDLGHIAGRGPRAEERSAYKGTHFMDCTAVLDNRLIGVRRVPVKITAVSIPKWTNQRSALLKLLGRR